MKHTRNHKNTHYFENKKAIKLINILTKKELTRFEKWLKAEITPQKRNVVTLYKMILADKSIRQIWEAIYPDNPMPESPFQCVGFRKIESQLTHYIEEFLAIKAFRKSRHTRDLFLIKELNRRDAEDIFHLEMRKIRRKTQNDPQKDCDYYRMIHELEVEYQVYINKHQIKGKDSFARSLSNTFNTWWLHEKLHLANNDLNHHLIKGEQIPTLLTREALDIISNHECYKKLPLLQIYQALNLLLTNQKEPGNIKDLVQKNKHTIAKKELKDIYALIFNTFARRANATGDPQYLKELVELCEWGVKDELIFRDGTLSWGVYKNIITIYLRASNLEQAFFYLNHFKQYLPVKEREEAYNFNLAQYYFEKKAFHEVIKILSMRFSNVYYEIQGRQLLVRAKYEIDQLDNYERELRSLKVFISRQKTIAMPRKTSEINQIRLFEEFLKTHMKNDFQNLLVKIENTQPLSGRKWLIEKIHDKLNVSTVRNRCL